MVRIISTSLKDDHPVSISWACTGAIKSRHIVLLLIAADFRELLPAICCPQSFQIPKGCLWQTVAMKSQIFDVKYISNLECCDKSITFFTTKSTFCSPWYYGALHRIQQWIFHPKKKPNFLISYKLMFGEWGQNEWKRSSISLHISKKWFQLISWYAENISKLWY